MYIEFPNGANILNGQIYTIYVLLARALVRIFDYLKILIFSNFYSDWKEYCFKRRCPKDDKNGSFWLQLSPIVHQTSNRMTEMRGGIKKLKNSVLRNRKLRKWWRGKTPCFYGSLVSSYRCKLCCFTVLKQLL